MALKIKMTISSTDHPQYEYIEFGTYEMEFDLDEMSQTSNHTWKQIIQEKAGVTLGRFAFLDYVIVEPIMRFKKLPDIKAGETPDA